MQFKPEEMANIMKDFDEPGFLAPTGLFLGPTKYMVIQGEPGAVIRGKKVPIRPSPDTPPSRLYLRRSISLLITGIPFSLVSRDLEA